MWGAVNRGWITILFLGLLVAAGLLYRRVPVFEATLAYLVTLVLVSSAIVDQYLAIPTAAIAVFLNVGFVIWLGMSSIYLLGEPADLNLPGFSQLKLHLLPGWGDSAFGDLVPALFAGWVIMTWWLCTKWRRPAGDYADSPPSMSP